jgi:hypothetical protein
LCLRPLLKHAPHMVSLVDACISCMVQS